MKTLIIAAILLLACNSAQADSSYLTGNDFLQFNTSTELSIIYGFAYGQSTLATVAKVKPLYCSPSNVTLNQDLLITLQYMKQHPEEMHYEISTLMALALMNAFPCQTTKETSKPETKF
jgi:hypothetical protein